MVKLLLWPIEAGIRLLLVLRFAGARRQACRGPAPIPGQDCGACEPCRARAWLRIWDRKG